MVSKSTKKTEILKSRKNIRTILIIISSLLLVIGLSQLFQHYQATNGAGDLPDANNVITKDTDVPEEKKPKDSDYNVPANQPRRISLPTIDTEGLIQKVGINSNNAISVPSNIHFGGWYVESVTPGELGLSIIDGHVSGKYQDGIFKNLKDVKTGDTFSIEFGDLSRRNFEVVEVRTLPEAESAAFLLTKRDDIEQQLNLITCGGEFNKDKQTYNDRVVVVSRAIK